ncbi:MAG: acyl-CoA dehydrogenase family protein, partial [Rhodospirillales bacterium]|nr:acyl-CoA dehydrogenase family protein [Rhodospirillales bacterium]
MNLEFSDKEVMFREEVREFVARELDSSIKNKVDKGLYLQKEDHLCWQGALYKQGWMAPNWPESFGGTGWNPIQRYIF